MPPKPRQNLKNPTSAKKQLPLKKQEPVKPETNSGLSQEAEDQFELELCWCIQQLEMCLASGKLQEKQAHDLGKNINILRSNTAPLIKKRQIMRNTLGNYREKMAMDEQKLSKPATTVKFINSAAPNNKSIFLKKACDKSKQEKENSCDNVVTENVPSKSIISNGNVEGPFKFNFQSVE